MISVGCYSDRRAVEGAAVQLYPAINALSEDLIKRTHHHSGLDRRRLLEVDGGGCARVINGLDPAQMGGYVRMEGEIRLESERTSRRSYGKLLSARIGQTVTEVGSRKEVL